MRRSSSVTSGCQRSYAAMASTPLLASATTCRSGSWLMMFATPVRSNAWSSTSMTVDLAAATGAIASEGNMHVRRLRRRLPRQDHFGAASRRGDDRERRADPLGTLLHARHAEAGRASIAREPAAVVGDGQADAD